MTSFYPNKLSLIDILKNSLNRLLIVVILQKMITALASNHFIDPTFYSIFK
jgi:hypothetical protein